MIVYPITLVLMISLPIALAYERSNNFRNRRMPITRSSFAGGTADGFPSKRNNLPFIIRVPYSKIVPSNALFSHSVSWKAKPAPQPTSVPVAGAKSADEPSTTTQTPADVQVSQFHAQDTNGQVVFGFNSPDQMRIEQRNADGTVHGTYSYLDPYGQIIKRQYWDTGAGFHVTSDSYPFGDLSPNGNDDNSLQNGAATANSQYTPEVQAARDLHFQLYQQALASFLPSAVNLRNDVRRNGSISASENNNSSANQQDSGITSDAIIVTPSATASDSVDTSTSSSPSSSQPPSSTSSMATPARLSIPSEDDDENVADSNQGSINIVEPDTENGSIVIQKPEYLRISWTTENKKYRVSGTGNRQNSDWSEKSTTTSSTTTKTLTASSVESLNVTNFIS